MDSQTGTIPTQLPNMASSDTNDSEDIREEPSQFSFLGANFALSNQIIPYYDNNY